MKRVIVTALFCAFAINMAGQQNPASTERDQSTEPKGPSGISLKDNPTANNHPERPKDEPPAWYAALERPDWWLVVIASLTGLAIWYQAREMTRATEEMKKTTEAAKKSADALINSERAWILVKVVHQVDGDEFPLTRSNGPDTRFCGEVILTNEGRSPCWITDVRLKFEIIESLPNIPDFTSQPTQKGCVGMSLGTKNGNHSIFWTPSFRGVESDAMMTVVYGIITYRDIFGENRATTFGLKVVQDRFVNTDTGTLERLTEYPEYNKNA